MTSLSSTVSGSHVEWASLYAVVKQKPLVFPSWVPAVFYSVLRRGGTAEEFELRHLLHPTFTAAYILFIYFIYDEIVQEYTEEYKQK